VTAFYCDRCDDGFDKRHFVCRKEADEKSGGEVRDAFIRGASWAYEELTGALIVPASFEQAAAAALINPTTTASEDAMEKK
jgi:hypothetical protein